MKPINWKKLSKKKKMEIAMNLMNSIRGSYILSQALFYGIDILKKEKYPEISNIEDMEILKEVLFPLFFNINIEKTKKMIKNK